MAPKIFITGVIGYIGGDALFALQKAHPDYTYTALVRNSDKGAPVAATLPNIRLVYGTNEDSKLLEEESAKADIVIHTADASDHAGAAKAIATGLAKGHTKEDPGFWLHTSGTNILTWKYAEEKNYGDGPSYPPYDDLENVSGLTCHPDYASHRDVDKLVLGASSESVKTAIVCPPTIYGTGRGPGNKRSQQVYNLVKVALEQGQALQIGKGLTEWDHVHVYDLSDLWGLLVDAAVENRKESDDKLWGREDYFLAENGHHVWGEVSKWVAEAAFEKGYIKEKSVKSLTPEEAKAAYNYADSTQGLNSRGHAKRARKYLGWKPHGRSLKDEIPDIVDQEATLLGMKMGHAETVAGAK